MLLSYGPAGLSVPAQGGLVDERTAYRLSLIKHTACMIEERRGRPTPEIENGRGRERERSQAGRDTIEIPKSREHGWMDGSMAGGGRGATINTTYILVRSSMVSLVSS